MMRFITTAPLVGLSLLLSAPVCLAQAPGKVTVRSAMFPGSGIEEPLELYVGEAKEGLEVPVWGAKFSPEFKLPRLDVWRFGHWDTETNDEGKTVRVFREKGRAKPPAGQRAWLIFFREKDGPEATLQVRAFDVDEASLKEGGTLVMNLSNGPIGAEIGDKKAKIEKLKQAVIEPGSRRGQSYPVKFYYSHNGQLRPFVATTWFHGERRKRLAIAVGGGEAAPPKLLTVDDIAAREGEANP